MGSDLERAARALFLNPECADNHYIDPTKLPALRAALPAEGATGAVAWCLADKHGNLSDAQFVQAHAEQVLAWWNDPARVDRLTNGPYRVVPLYAHPAPADAGVAVDAEIRAHMGAMRAALSQIDASPWFHESAPNVIRERVAALLAYRAARPA